MLDLKGDLECWGPVSGIITRCPLELKMKKQPWDQAWNGTISYRGVRLTLKDPSHVEREIRKGEALMASAAPGS